MYRKLSDSMTVSSKATIRDALTVLDREGTGFLVVSEGEKGYIGIVTEGDIRREILKGSGIYDSIPVNKNPVTVRDEGENQKVPAILNDYDFVLVEKDKKPIGYFTKDRGKINVPLVVMAGGEGKRLRPATDVIPKPLIPVNGLPILDHILAQFSAAGVKEKYITVGPKAEMIQAYYSGKGHIFIQEDQPQGTAGALRYLELDPDGPVIVTNCDVLVDIDYAELLQHHQFSYAGITIVGAIMTNVIPYGVCELRDEYLSCIKEKPESSYIAMTGVYVVESELFKMIPDQRYDMTELIENALKVGTAVGVYPIPASKWIDIGRWEEYRKVLDDFRVKGIG